MKYCNTDTTNADAPAKVDSIRFEWMHDNSPDLSWLEQTYDEGGISLRERAAYVAQDTARLAAYHAGEWTMQGCRAVAIVSRPIGQGSRRLQEFTSGGLWGIESDSSAEYKKEVEAQELADLKQHLSAFGIEINETA